MRNHDSDHDIEMTQRREVLKRVAWMLGGAISTPAVLGILQGCSARDAAPADTPWVPRFLNTAQAGVVAEIAELMIPRTTTGGARDAGVPAFIDLMLADVYGEGERQRFKQGLADFEAAAKTRGKPFLEQDVAQRTALVKQSLESSLAQMREPTEERERENDAEGKPAAQRKPKPFMLMTRELTLLGYFTSKIGASEIMNWVPVPGAYHGCVPVASLAKRVSFE